MSLRILIGGLVAFGAILAATEPASALIEKPKVQYSEQERRDNFTRHRISVEIAPDDLPGYTNRAAMTNRKSHSPTPESNDRIYAFLEHFLKSHQQQSAYSQAVNRRIPWESMKNGLGHSKNMRVCRVALHRDGTLFAIICAKRPAYGKALAGEGVGLYRSMDGAQTWEKVNASRLFLYPKDFSVHPEDSDIILVGTCDANWQDKSGGMTELLFPSPARLGNPGPFWRWYNCIVCAFCSATAR